MNFFRLLTIFSSLIFAASDFANAVDKTEVERSIEIIGNDLSEAEVSSIQQTINLARIKYELSFPTVPGKIKVYVNKTKALRAGYNLKDDSIHLPKVKGVLNSGINSVDVINHEAFHLFTCRAFPNTCPDEIGKNEEFIQLQESLADFFAYNLNPDKCFGENFYENQTCIRNYDNNFLISLMDSPHLKGNALTKYLIENEITLEQISLFFVNSKKIGFNQNTLKALSESLQKDLDLDVSMDLQDEVVGAKHSTSRKYWINEGERLKLTFNPNTALAKKYPLLNISWSSKNGMKPDYFIITGDDLSFQVSPMPNAKPEKIIATIRNGSEIIGYRAYYFGMRYKRN